MANQKTGSTEPTPRLSKLERLQQELAAAQEAQKAKVQKRYDDATAALGKALEAQTKAAAKVETLQAELDDIAREANDLGIEMSVVPVAVETPAVDPADDDSE